MKKKRFNDAQITQILKAHEAGVSVADNIEFLMLSTTSIIKC